MLPKEEYKILSSIVHRYEQGNPWTEKQLTPIQSKLQELGLISSEKSTRELNGKQLDCFKLQPTASGWSFVNKDKTVPAELGGDSAVKINLDSNSSKAYQNKTFCPPEESDFEFFFDCLVGPLMKNAPSEITFHNFKLYMCAKSPYKYCKDWRIVDFRNANRGLYENICTELPESNKNTLFTLLDMLFYMNSIKDNSLG